MSWLEKIVTGIVSIDSSVKSKIPDGLWKQCSGCKAILYQPELEKNLYVCPKCQHHMYLSARDRLDSFLDSQGRQEIAANLRPVDLLKFKDLKKYKDRLVAAQKVTKELDALVAFRGLLNGLPIVVCAFEFKFMGGSMGGVVGEKFVNAVNEAIAHKAPLVCFSTSGGARMQESLLSLMQMAKTSAAIAKLNDNNIPYISVLTNPVYGGVTASLSMLGDINIAEPDALIGFAGQRVIAQTIGQSLPEGFQTSEFLLDHGGIDMIMPRSKMKSKIHAILSLLQY